MIDHSYRPIEESHQVTVLRQHGIAEGRRYPVDRFEQLDEAVLQDNDSSPRHVSTLIHQHLAVLLPHSDEELVDRHGCIDRDLPAE